MTRNVGKWDWCYFFAEDEGLEKLIYENLILIRKLSLYYPTETYVIEFNMLEKQNT